MGRSGYDNEGEEFPAASGKLLYMGEKDAAEEAEEGDRYGAEPMLEGEVAVSEYIKDDTQELGWKSISHDRKDKDGVDADVANLNPDAMDEGFDGGSDIEPETV